MPDSDYLNLTDASRAIRCGDVRPIELVDACLDKIERFDDQIRAWELVDAASAREEAVRLGDTQWRGPLHGIPIGVKDIVDVAGMPTRAGSPLTDREPVKSDAPIVTQLRNAGAIILGKTVTTEFACFDPAPTCNPCDSQRTPGGSSSGSAAAVATRMCYAAVGSQTGGSIIRPATYCGVAGLKPTLGVWSTDGVVPVSFHLDHVGPLARTVSDLSLVWQAIMATELPVSWPPAAEELDAPTLVVPRTFFFENADRKMLPAIERAVSQLISAGARVVDGELPDSFSTVLQMHRRIMAVELAEWHRDQFAQSRDRYAAGVAAMIAEGLRTKVTEYAAALKHRQQFIREIGECLPEPHSIWLTPATTSAAPGRETTGDPSFNSPWSYCGFPAISFPCGQSEDGLPVGLQMVARPRAEEQLFRAALWCEASRMR